MVYENYTYSPNVIILFGEAEDDLKDMPTLTTEGKGKYKRYGIVPPSTIAKILTEDGLRIYMLRSTGWVDVTDSYESSHGGSSGTGTDNYNSLTNKPKINGVTLRNDKTFEDLGWVPYTTAEIQVLWDSI